MDPVGVVASAPGSTTADVSPLHAVHLPEGLLDSAANGLVCLASSAGRAVRSWLESAEVAWPSGVDVAFEQGDGLDGEPDHRGDTASDSSGQHVVRIALGNLDFDRIALTLAHEMAHVALNVVPRPGRPPGRAGGPASEYLAVRLSPAIHAAMAGGGDGVARAALAGLMAGFLGLLPAAEGRARAAAADVLRVLDPDPAFVGCMTAVALLGRQVGYAVACGDALGFAIAPSALTAPLDAPTSAFVSHLAADLRSAGARLPAGFRAADVVRFDGAFGVPWVRQYGASVAVLALQLSEETARAARTPEGQAWLNAMAA